MVTRVEAVCLANGPNPMIVTAKHAADVLFNVATVFELAGDAPYRVRAYRRAARILLSARGDMTLTPDGDLDCPGLGPALRRKLGKVVRGATPPAQPRPEREEGER